jgi:hypothetical protein
MAYDIIGDIHGECDALEALLIKLDYSVVDGSWRHPNRKVIFLGDFIDRGPQQKAVLDVVIPMVNQGAALAVMGNHEFNALAFATRNSDDSDWLRPRSEKNIKQHAAFLDEYNDKPAERNAALEFFNSLPLWLDLEGLRIVHACWDETSIKRITAKYGGAALTEELLHLGSTQGTKEFTDVETLLKGKELPLPEGVVFHDKDGIERRDIRVKWWDKTAKTYQDAFLGPDTVRDKIPAKLTEGSHLAPDSEKGSPVFFGHYWMTGSPASLADNVACLDYSVARPGGALAAYRWSGETSLDDANFVWVTKP